MGSIKILVNKDIPIQGRREAELRVIFLRKWDGRCFYKGISVGRKRLVSSKWTHATCLLEISECKWAQIEHHSTGYSRKQFAHCCEVTYADMTLVSEQQLQVWCSASGTLPKNFPSQLYDTVAIKIPLVLLPPGQTQLQSRKPQKQTTRKPLTGSYSSNSRVTEYLLCTKHRFWDYKRKTLVTARWVKN